MFQEFSGPICEYIKVSLLTSRYVVVYDTICESNIDRFNDDLLEHGHEEADTLMILHALDVSSSDPFKEVTVSSPDTDVFLLLLYFYPRLCNITLFQTGTKRNLRTINVGSAYEAIGTKQATALLGFHSFTGCDFTSKFNGKSKASCWRCFIEADDDILEAFQYLGESEAFPSATTIASLEKFVVQLYCGKKLASIKDLGSARWYLFSKYQLESEKLPPTSSALKFKIHRSHYVSMIWRSSDISRPCLPNL